jgi:hypothetical protein
MSRTQLKRVTDAERARLRAHPDAVPAFLFGAPGAAEDRRDLDLAKAWHGLHVVRTGTAAAGAPPLNFLAAGGAPLGADLGYGPARALPSTGVRQLAAALAAFGAADLQARIDPRALARAGAYPDVWDRDAEAARNRAWLLAAFAAVKAFVDGAARDGAGLLGYLL